MNSSSKFYDWIWSLKLLFLLLFLVTGAIRQGQVLAIMGASGAGKTTLLNCLTFRNSGNLEILGQRYLNKSPVQPDSLARISGYVQQNELFIGCLTVKELLRFQVSNLYYSTFSGIYYYVMCGILKDF